MANETEAEAEYIEKAKTLGAIQIMIGFIYIGFGTILGLMNYVSEDIGNFASITLIAGYPFWGGISFIISGSLSVSASPTDDDLLKASSGLMNMASAIITLIGVVLLGHDVSIEVEFIEDYGAVVLGKGISAMLMIFSLLEFFIAYATCNFVDMSN